MPQIGPLEILTLAAVALIVFGPQKLPEVARSVGRFMSEMRRMASEVKTEFSAALAEDEADRPDEASAPEVADEDSEAIEEAAPPSTEER